MYQAEEKLSGLSSDEAVKSDSSPSETRSSDSKSFEQWEPFHGSAFNLTPTRVEEWYRLSSSALFAYQRWGLGNCTEKPSLQESKAVRRYINFPNSRLEEISGNLIEFKVVKVETTDDTNTYASTPQTKAEMTALWNNFAMAWREATSNVLKYFKESRSPPSSHELEAVIRFINTMASEIETEIKKPSIKPPRW